MGKVYIEDDKLIVKTDNWIIKSDGTFYAELESSKIYTIDAYSISFLLTAINKVGAIYVNDLIYPENHVYRIFTNEALKSEIDKLKDQLNKYKCLLQENENLKREISRLEIIEHDNRASIKKLELLTDKIKEYNSNPKIFWERIKM